MTMFYKILIMIALICSLASFITSVIAVLLYQRNTEDTIAILSGRIAFLSRKVSDEQ